MIVELIMDGLQVVILLIFNLLPEMPVLAIPEGFIGWFTNIVGSVAYVLPIADMILMFSIWLLVINWHLIYKVVMKIWHAIPLV